MTDGIILAGGYSSRLGTNKMNIQFKGKSVIRHTIEHMQHVCQHIYVVTGFYHDEIKPMIESIKNVKVIYNPDYEQGMFTSVKKGVECIENDFFLIPGDFPMVDESVYNKLLLGTNDIRVPSFSFKLGHPIFFKKRFKKLILDTKLDSLKTFRNQYDFEIIEVETSDILFDIDTLQDVDSLKAKE